MRKVILITLMLLPGALLGQQGRKAATPPQAVAAPAPAAAVYQFPLEDKMQIRDLQFANDQLEIENKTLQIKIEQNKQQQKDLVDKIKQIAYNFSVRQKIDLSAYEFELTTVQFKQKPSMPPLLSTATPAK